MHNTFTSLTSIFPAEIIGFIEQLLIGLAAMLFTGMLSFSLTPFARVLGFKIGAVDIPDTTRHFHRKPTPRCGGVAIFTAFFTGVLLFCRPLEAETIGLLLGTLAIMLLGLWDDTVQLKPIVKLLGQIVCATIPILYGVRIESITLFGGELNLGIFAVPATLFWIVFLTNAVNLIDGLDGLACGVSAISSVTLLICSIISSQTPSVILIIAILASACVGFLPFNMSPAKIFMGDSGALSLGFVLSVLSVMGVFKVDAIYSFLIPLLIFALPLFDTAMSFIRRILHKQSPFAADRKHLHHRLLDFGFRQKEVVAFLLSFSAVLGISAVMFCLENFLVAILIAAVAVFLLGLTFIIFRHKKVSEFLKLQKEELPKNEEDEDSVAEQDEHEGQEQ